MRRGVQGGACGQIAVLCRLESGEWAQSPLRRGSETRRVLDRVNRKIVVAESLLCLWCAGSTPVCSQVRPVDCTRGRAFALFIQYTEDTRTCGQCGTRRLTATTTIRPSGTNAKKTTNQNTTASVALGGIRHVRIGAIRTRRPPSPRPPKTPNLCRRRGLWSFRSGRPNCQAGTDRIRPTATAVSSCVRRTGCANSPHWRMGGQAVRSV